MGRVSLRRLPLVATVAVMIVPATAARAALRGDGNQDGRVSAADIVALVRIIGGEPSNSDADANQDGTVDAADLPAAIAAAFGVALPAATPTSTPQPSATSMAAATPTVTSSRTGTEPASFETPTPTHTSTGGPATATSTASATAGPVCTPPLCGPGTVLSCPSGDCPGGCGVQCVTPTGGPASPTPTATVTPQTPAATQAPDTGPVEAIAGNSVVVANGMAAIPMVISAIISGFEYGSGATFGGGGGGFSLDGDGGGQCPLGQTAKYTCGSAGFGSARITITLDNCGVPTSGGSMFLTGTVVLTGPGFCPLVMPPYSSTIDLEGVVKDAEGATKQTISIHLTGSVNANVSPFKCYVNSATLTLSGTIATNYPGLGGLTMGLQGTRVGIDVAHFTTKCVPDDYTLAFSGPATIEQTSGAAAVDGGSGAVAVVFNDFRVHQNVGDSATQTELNGGMSAACFGGEATIETLEPLIQALGEPCPQSGLLKVTSVDGIANVRYSSGQVGIDRDRDGTDDDAFPSCLDPSLVGCVAAGGTRTPNPTPTQTETIPPSPTLTATADQGDSGTPTLTWTPTPTWTPHPPWTPTPTRTPTQPQAGATPTPTTTAPGAPTLTPADTYIPEVYCSFPEGVPPSVPDDNPQGLQSDLVVESPASISDLNVSVYVEHERVGDLKVTLRHMETGTSVVLVDRPGHPQAANGCSGHDMFATLDDEAPEAVEGECTEDVPSIGGILRPNGSLAQFDGQSLAGTWRLTVVDNAAGSEGRLWGFCVEANITAPAITKVTCNGSGFCEVGFDEPFTIEFGFLDADGNAVSWRMIAVRDDGTIFDVASGIFDPPAGGGSISVPLPDGVVCDSPPCEPTYFDFVVVVSDADEQDSVEGSAVVLAGEIIL